MIQPQEVDPTLLSPLKVLGYRLYRGNESSIARIGTMVNKPYLGNKEVVEVMIEKDVIGFLWGLREPLDIDVSNAELHPRSERFSSEFGRLEFCLSRAWNRAKSPLSRAYYRIARRYFLAVAGLFLACSNYWTRALARSKGSVESLLVGSSLLRRVGGLESILDSGSVDRLPLNIAPAIWTVIVGHVLIIAGDDLGCDKVPLLGYIYGITLKRSLLLESVYGAIVLEDYHWMGSEEGLGTWSEDSTRTISDEGIGALLKEGTKISSEEGIGVSLGAS